MLKRRSGDSQEREKSTPFLHVLFFLFNRKLRIPIRNDLMFFQSVSLNREDIDSELGYDIDSE